MDGTNSTIPHRIIFEGRTFQYPIPESFEEKIIRIWISTQKFTFILYMNWLWKLSGLCFWWSPQRLIENKKKRKVFEWIWLDYERSVSNFYFSAKWKWIIWKYSGELAEKLLTQICNNKLLQSFVNCMLKHSEIPPNHWNFFQLTFTDRPETNLVQPDECLPEVFQ